MMASIQAQNINNPDHVENLNETKYKIIKQAMMSTLSSDIGMTFKDLEEAVKRVVNSNQANLALFPKPGSVRWYCKAVQLDLEAKGEIERLRNISPLQLRLTPGSLT